MKKSLVDQKSILLYARMFEDDQQPEAEQQDDASLGDDLFDDAEDSGDEDEDDSDEEDSDEEDDDSQEDSMMSSSPVNSDNNEVLSKAISTLGQVTNKALDTLTHQNVKPGFANDLYDQSVLTTGDPNGDDVNNATLNRPNPLTDEEAQVVEAFRKFKKNKLNERAIRLYEEMEGSEEPDLEPETEDAGEGMDMDMGEQAKRLYRSIREDAGGMR